MLKIRFGSKYSRTFLRVFSRGYFTPTTEQIHQIAQIKQSKIPDFTKLTSSILATSDAESQSLIKDSAVVKDFINVINESDLGSDIKCAVMDKVLIDYLRHDFSISYCIKNHQYSSRSLSELIKYNPGRVRSSWEFYKELSKSEDDNNNDLVRVELIKKLLMGENFEIRNNEFILDGLNLARFIIVCRELKNADRVKPHFETWVKSITDEKISSIIDAVAPPVELVGALLSGELDLKLDDDLFYARFFEYYFNTVKEKDPEVITPELLIKALTSLGKLSKNLPNQTIESKILNEINKELTKHNHDIVSLKRVTLETISKLHESIVSFIEARKLSKGSNEAALALRLQLMESYGMDQTNFSKALELYHHYLTFEKFGLPAIQNKMISVCCYNAVDQNNEINLSIAETLLLSEVPIRIIRALILANAEFDTDKSLQIYNDYIKNVSREVIPATKESGAGMLTEALVLSYLYSNDREFAYLINDKAIENKIVSDEFEISRLKSLFKLYGDAVIDENFEDGKIVLKRKVLELIRA